MPDVSTPERPSAVTLPPTAPKIRITAGLGTARQKTWNLRRPVTFIGASRLAHIVLAKEDVSRAHCIIVNTGCNVLLKDLHSTNGTRRNGKRGDLMILDDGDVLRLGDTTIQIAIQVLGLGPGDTDTGIRYRDPLTLPEPVVLHRPDSFDHWTVERAVTIIGSRPCVSIQLDHPDVSLVHAALVCIGGNLAVFDLSSGTGTRVSGRRETLAALNPGDCLKVGPFQMVVAGAATSVASPQNATGEVAIGAGLGEDHSAALEAELKARVLELERREQQLEEEKAAVEAARAAIENDRRALEQQALALGEARARLDVEPELMSWCGLRPQPKATGNRQ